MWVKLDKWVEQATEIKATFNALEIILFKMHLSSTTWAKPMAQFQFGCQAQRFAW